MAAAAGKKSTTSLSLLMAAYGFEVEVELPTMATQHWAEGVWTGKWQNEQKEAWMRQIQEVLSPISILEEVGSKSRTGRAEGGSMDRTCSGSLAKEIERGLDREAS